MSTGLVYLPGERFNPPSQNNSQERNYFMPQTLSTSPENNFNPDVSSSLQQVDNWSLMNDETMSNIDSIQETADSTAQHFYNASNAWKIPTRPVGLTITWTSRESSVVTEDQRKRFKNLNKALKNPEGAIVQVADRLTVSTKVIRVTIKQELHDAWFMFSKGFENFGQNEIAFFLEKRIAEDVFPFEMFKIFRTLYSLTSKQGQRFRHCNYLAFSNSLLGSEENVGFLFISAKKLPNVVRHYINGNSAIVGILLKYTELACARYIPARLLNALGAQQQTFPSPAISSRDRPFVVNLPSDEIFYSTFVAFNQFLNNKIPQVLIPEVHILKSNSRVILELPFLYQTEVLSMLDALLVKDDEPVTIPIAGDIVPQASGHFVYTVNNATSNRRGFVVLQNSDQSVEPGSQFLAFSAILLIFNLGDASSSRKRYGIEVIEDGIKVTLKDRQAREIRQAIYEGTNCSLSIGDTADSNDQFILRWTGDTCPSVVESPNPVRIVQDVRPNRSYYSTAVQTQSAVRTEAGQTNVIIDRVKTREIEAAIMKKLISSSDCNPQEIVNQLETNVRQACGTSLLTFANRLKIHAEKRLNITLSLGPGNFKKWSIGPNNQPINLARSLQLALSEVNVPAVNDNIVFVFNVILQKKN
ncbi:uncharacterized protein LOC124447134 isoform X2 [Xenia sp. Carnegie-2017]|nr:uncharacterized protein LOC124447134 isoform X2 [Xenia sp. Carnegie-2017]